MTDKVLDVFGDSTVACAALSKTAPAFKTALAAIKKPVIRRRQGGFEGLFRIIVEQQVSVASAQAVWSRCEKSFKNPTPRKILKAGEKKLCAAGLSRPKAHYVFGLADAIDQGRMDLAQTARLSDQEALEFLQSIKGVGPWTSAIYLLFCEGRADIWPAKDVALKHAYNAANGAPDPVNQNQLDDHAATWAPWRGVAAHIMWTYYAHLRGRAPI